MGVVVNNRLEASTRGTDLLPGLHARVHDALWLLARQWQLGELDGLDGGSPISASLVARSRPLATWQPGWWRPTSLRRQRSARGARGVRRRATAVAGRRRRRAAAGAGPAPGRPRPGRLDRGPSTRRTRSGSGPGRRSRRPRHQRGHAGRGRRRRCGHRRAGARPGRRRRGVRRRHRATVVTLAGGTKATAPLADWRAWWAARQPHPSGAWQPGQLSYCLTAATADGALPQYVAPTVRRRSPRLDGVRRRLAGHARPDAADPRLRRRPRSRIR